MPIRVERECVKKVATFLFSHVGLALIVLGYCVMGGFLFQAIEAPYESKEKLRIKKFKEDTTVEILKLAQLYGYKKIDTENATAWIEGILLQMQEQVTLAVKNNGWNGKDDMDEEAVQWSFAGSLLYAVTVVTTIGYGHIAPKTVSGRLVTILYALVGIPLTFLYLSNMGNAMAECFRLFYKKVCCIVCIYCCQPKRPQRNKNLEVMTTVRLEMASRRNRGFEMEDEYPSTYDVANRRVSMTDPPWPDATRRRSSLFHRDTPPRYPMGNHRSHGDHEIPTVIPREHHSSSHPKGVRFSGLISQDDSDSLNVNNSIESGSYSRDGGYMKRGQHLGVDNRGADGGDVSPGANRLCDRCVEVVRQYMEEKPAGKAAWIGGDIDKRTNGNGNIKKHGTSNSRHPDRRDSSVSVTCRTPDSLEDRRASDSDGSDVLLKADRAIRDAFVTSLDYETDYVLDRRKKPHYKDASVQTYFNKYPTNSGDQSCDIAPATSNQDDSMTLRATRSTDSRWSSGESPRVWREVCRYDPDSFRRRRRSTLRLQWPKRRNTLTGEEEETTKLGPQLSPEEANERRGKLSILKSTIESEISRRISTFDPVLLERRRKSSFAMKQTLEGEEGEREILYSDTIDTSVDFDQDFNEEPKVTVPISICLIIIALYIFAGSLLFTIWEDWDYITGSYFCFVTLSTIGFGDIVPGTDMKEGAAHRKFLLCSMWLVVGLSLLAMCFNLMQEEVKDKCIWLGRKFGILKDDNF